VRTLGIVKWFSDAKGYGFIEHSSGVEVFVHFRDIRSSGRRTLAAGEPVELEVVQDLRGPRAQNVSRLDSTGTPAPAQEIRRVSSRGPAGTIPHGAA